MSLYKVCTRCKKKLELGKKCDNCSKNTNRVYDINVRDKDSRDFYHSKEWNATRDKVLNRYNYLDLYELKVNGKIVPADLVHHIIELKEDKSKALDRSNLIPLSNATHNYIHSVYNKSEEDKHKLQNVLFTLVKN